MYVKLFASIYQGTLRGKSHGLLVFTNLLAHCDRDGVADIHPKAIADEVGLPLADVQAALYELEAPDDESRTPDEGGRRIIRVDEHRAWGWRVVNYAKYRAIRNDDDRREANRVAVAKHRAKVKAGNPASSPVIGRNRKSSVSPQGEGEGDGKGEADGEAKTKQPAPAAPSWSPPDWVPAQEWSDFVLHRKAMRGVPFTDAAKTGVIRELAKLWEAGHDPATLLTTAITRGWRTVFAPKPENGATGRAGALPGMSKADAQIARNIAVAQRWEERNRPTETN
jgi:hypothetical protein